MLTRSVNLDVSSFTRDLWTSAPANLNLAVHYDMSADEGQFQPFLDPVRDSCFLLGGPILPILVPKLWPSGRLTVQPLLEFAQLLLKHVEQVVSALNVSLLVHIQQLNHVIDRGW